MQNGQEFVEYVQTRFQDVTDDLIDEKHLSGYCPECRREVAFDVVTHHMSAVYQLGRYGSNQTLVPEQPQTLLFSCPIRTCSFFKFWIITKIEINGVDRTYLVASIPDQHEEIPGIPETYTQLLASYREAIRCMNAGAPMAAAAMFRRALQVITREILGAPAGELAAELSALKGKPNSLGVVLTTDFSTNAYIVRKAGNQGAHPDKDPDPLDFGKEDAESLHQIFIEIVTEIFVMPEAAKKAKDEFLKRRKISSG